MSVNCILTNQIPSAAEVGAATPAYVNEQIQLITETGIPKLQVYTQEVTAVTDGQTTFTIDLETFDVKTDTVLMLDGRGLLLPNSDFTVSGNVVTVVDAWNAGDVGGLLILKNVPMGEDGSVSGAVIAPGTIPASALSEEYLPLNDVGAFITLKHLLH